MPDWRSELQQRLRGLALRPEREAEIVEELAVHLEERYAELALAHPPAEARRMALAELDASHALADRLSPLRQAREARRWLPPPGTPRRRLVADVWQDLRYAMRLFARQPGFALAAVLTLALGIGANTAAFSLVDAMLLRPMGVAGPDRLVHVSLGIGNSGTYSYPWYEDVRDNSRGLDGLAAYGSVAATMTVDAHTELVTGEIVSGNFFDVLGVQPALGRLLTEADDRTPMAHPVAVISHRLWQRRFAGDADIAGREILLNGHRFTIVGVTSPVFRGPDLGTNTDLYVPMMMQPLIRPPRAGYSGDMDPDLLRSRTNSWLRAIGRLSADSSPESVSAALSGFATAHFRALNPEVDPRTIEVSLTPYTAGAFGQRTEMTSAATLLLAAVGMVLLIGCANIANLLLARAASRQGEVALRLAVGASRGRIVRQLLTESLLLSLAGGAVGAGLAWLTIAAFRAVPPPPGALPVALEFATDVRVLGFTLGLSLLTGVLFGLVPAVRSARPGLVPALKTDPGSHPNPDGRRRRPTLKKTLVVAEVALALVLLVLSGLFVRSLRATQAVDPQFDMDRLVTAPLNVNLLRYTSEQGRTFYARVLETMEAIPGVESASLSRVAVLTGAARRVGMEVQGREPTGVLANVVGPRFFETLGVPLLQGRPFGPTDAANAPPVVVVNETLARRFFDGKAVGQRLRVVGNTSWSEIVGVVADSKYVSLEQPDTPTLYVPLGQNHETGVTLYVRAAGDPASLIGPVRDALRSLEPNLPATNISVATKVVATALYSARMGAVLLAALGGVALVLAAVGIYGVLAFSTARRTHEIGIRSALGADARDVLGLIVREGMTLVAIGVGIGLAASTFAARAIESYLFGIQPLDAVTFVAGPLLLGGIALAACLIPAWRATRVDPTTALRTVA